MNLDRLRLGVNIDHIATLRNARGGIHPDPVEGARLAIEAGADGITAHLREDRRHITDDDMERLQAFCTETNTPLNMEIAATAEMLDIAMTVKPHAICIVPERRAERTTEGGLNIAGLHNHITPMIRQLGENGSRVSLFIEADPHQIECAAKTGAPVIEIHTGAYAHALEDGDADKAAHILGKMTAGAALGHELGLEVHAGHGITFANVKEIASIPELVELNIGHYLIGESIFAGLSTVLAQMRWLMDDARGLTS